MRLHRVLPLGLGALAVAACHEDKVTTSNPPALAAVRYIHGMPDTISVDIRMLDQVSWTAFANGLAFRGATEYMPTEAKARPIRVFPTSRDPSVTSKPFFDETVTFEAGKRYTLMLTGTAGNRHFLVLNDDVPACNSDVAIRAVNAGGTAAGLDLLLTRLVADPRPAAPLFSNITPMTASAYVSRAPDTGYVRILPTGFAAGDKALDSAAVPLPPAAEAGKRPAAGFTTACSAYSAIAFPKSSGSQTAFANPGVVFFLDRTPGL